MSAEAWAAVMALLGILGGAFGKDLLNRWFDRDKQLSEQAAQQAGSQHQRAFADNEQARLWLREQLTEAEQELRSVRENERALLKQVGELAAQVARMEARTDAQTARIDDLSATVARLGADYAEMKAERDEYRLQKHSAENKLTAESLARQLAERDKAALTLEVERLRTLLEAKEPPA